ncbi:MAG TPA: hypothetical protein PLQ19_02330 [Aeromicrobium sp.]|nr:hypothetical protein [Aeromicrobium sp.]
MRRLTIASVALLVVCALGACTPNKQSPSPDSTTDPAPINAHEAGPASPIGFGVSVPEGAVQLGPLVRFRSPELVAAYLPELQAVQAELAAEELKKSADTPSTATPSSPTTPTPSNRPERDTFADLESMPRPDTFVSVMRIDKSPTKTVRKMLAQIAVLLPGSEIVTDDLSKYCQAENRRVVNCALNVTGKSPSGRDLNVQLNVDPGDVRTRTGSTGSLESPVMTVAIAYVGDPREGQKDRTPERLENPVDIDSTAEATGWIWPKMDEDAPATEPVIDGYTPPSSSTVLLSANRPEFATMTTLRATIASEIATSFIGDRVPSANISRDVVADLNEVISTSWGTDRRGRQIRTVHTLSARGNYLTLFVSAAKS